MALGLYVFGSVSCVERMERGFQGVSNVLGMFAALHIAQDCKHVPQESKCHRICRLKS